MSIRLIYVQRITYIFLAKANEPQLFSPFVASSFLYQLSSIYIYSYSIHSLGWHLRAINLDDTGSEIFTVYLANSHSSLVNCDYIAFNYPFIHLLISSYHPSMDLSYRPTDTSPHLKKLELPYSVARERIPTQDYRAAFTGGRRVGGVVGGGAGWRRSMSPSHISHTRQRSKFMYCFWIQSQRNLDPAKRKPCTFGDSVRYKPTA